MTRTPISLALVALGAVTVAACSPAATVTETQTMVVTVTPTATVAPPPEEQAFNDWVISPDGLGPMTVDLTAEELGELTGLDYSGDLDYFDGNCAAFGLGGAGALSSMSALAESDGAYGPIDSYTVGANELYQGPFPATADGITIGSSFTELDMRYGDGLVIEESIYDPTWSRAWTLEGDMGILFLVDDVGEVVSITVGRDPQFLYVEGCA